MASITTVPIHGHSPEVYTSEASGRPSLEHQHENEEFIVGGAYARFLRISSFFGLAPLRFKPRGNGYVVSLSILMCIYSYILMTVFALLAAFYCVMLDLGTDSAVSRLVSYSGLAHCFAVGVGVYGAPCRMRKLIKSMSTIALVDQSIDARYSPAMERRVCRYPAIYFFFFTFVTVADIVIFTLVQYKNSLAPHNILSLRTMSYISSYLNCILMMQFAFTAMSVRARFAAVNKVLSFTAKQLAVPYVEKEESPYILNIFARRLAQAGLHSKTIVMRKCATGQRRRLAVPLSDAVQRVSFLRDLLCDVVDDVTNSYGVILIFDLISTAFNIIATLYLYLVEIYKEANEFTILQGLWFIVCLLALFMSVEPCHYTIEESKKTEGIVSRMISESPSQGALASRLRVFSRQLVLRRAGYEPMGFFTLNRSLVASIFEIVATYLVILLQFHGSSSR